MSPTFSSAMIPPGWAAHHQPAVATSHQAVGTIRKEDRVEFDPATRRNVRWLGRVRYLDVKMRVQRQQSSADPHVGEQSEHLTRYVVAMGVDYQPVAGDVISVTTSDDPLLKELSVVWVYTGSERFERNVLCAESPHALLPVGEVDPNA